MSPYLPSPMNFGEILEEEQRAAKPRQERAIVIDRNRVKPYFHVCHVLQEKSGHICINAFAIWYWRICVRGVSSGASPWPNPLRHLADGYTVPNVPGDARKLGRGICHAQSQTTERTCHVHPERLVLIPLATVLRVPMMRSPLEIDNCAAVDHGG